MAQRRTSIRPRLGRLETFSVAVVLALGSGLTGEGALANQVPDLMLLEDYLGLLEQIAPAARQGAEAYVGAYRLRCGQVMTTSELRQAMAREGGEPVLMAILRASQQQDAKAVASLARRVPCRGRQ